ncbi:hypothetical protein M422DRAFT_174124 [Sphaerobolus stellatus SS14]|uniref:Serine aminopeptidase S33 domain-containing protein n=1 Tax=Sphaerobolus stellatus (strain SS14) TaxID=990650 RepID=A0A0C9VQL1_SPHS4|nr:hypothetical protein M422DRAFT_174124 [Sphaerobolus stellatus SS14]
MPAEVSTRQTFTIPSVEEGVFIDAWVFSPTMAPHPHPVVIAGHGMNLTKDVGLTAFCDRWAEDAGWASVAFDYRGYGASGGEPRQYVSLRKQNEDYRSVIKWVRERTELFRSDKIVLFGISLAGVTVSDLITKDEHLCGALMTCPVIDCRFRAPKSLPVLLSVNIAGIKDLLGLSPTYITAVGPPKTAALQTRPSAYPGYLQLYKESGVEFTEEKNRMAAKPVWEFFGSRPNRRFKHAKAPILVIAAEEDDIVPMSLQRKIEGQSGGHMKLVVVPGNHFSVLIPGTNHFEANINAQLEYLRELS